MRLSSKFHDYYDAVLAHGTDQTLVYNRENSETEISGVILDQLPETLKDWLDNQPSIYERDADYHNCAMNPVERGLILFAGNVYPYVTFRVPDPSQRPESYCWRPGKLVTCYTMADVESCLQEYGNKYDAQRLQPDPTQPVVQKHLRRDSRYRRVSIYSHEGLTNFLAPVEFPWAQDWHLKYQVPIMKLRRERDFRHTDAKAFKLHVELNPELTPLQFFRAVDAYTAFQELSMYLSGVLRVNEPDTLEIADPVRLEGHGFDKATSFRQVGPKQGRKSRKAKKKHKAT